jgi:hypothetical protein
MIMDENEYKVTKLGCTIDKLWFFWLYFKINDKK